MRCSHCLQRATALMSPYGGSVPFAELVAVCNDHNPYQFSFLRKGDPPMSEPTPSIDALNLALDNLITAVINANHMNRLQEHAHSLLRSSLDELAALRAQVAEQRARWERVKPVLRYVDRDIEHRLSGYYAEDEAIALQARALLGEGGQ